MKRIQRSNKLLLIAFALLVLVQIPFLFTDPDTLADVNTRGAWIDESLYVFQAREWIDSGQLDIAVNDAFVRSPVFQLLVSGFFLIFGTHLFAARLMTVVVVAAALAFTISRKHTRTLGWVMAGVLFTQYHIFQFSHHSLVYMVAIAWLLFALVFLTEAYEGYRVNRNVFLANLFVFLAYGTSVQMLPAAVIVPAVCFILWITRLKKPDSTPWMFITAAGYSALFGLLYFLIWYLPNRNMFDTIVFFQAEGRFPTSLYEFAQTFRFNFINCLWIRKLMPYFMLAGITVLAWPFVMRKNTSLAHKAVFLFALFWLIIEFPKTGMFYIPFRYLLGFITAMSLLVSLGITRLLQEKAPWKYGAVVLIAAVFITNVIHAVNSWNRRTYDIEKANEIMAQRIADNEVALGAWAPAFTWDVCVKCVPVWNEYMNDDQPIEKYQPTIIVSEFNEADSDNYYSKHGYNLKEISDTITAVKVWRYDLVFYSLKK